MIGSDHLTIEEITMDQLTAALLASIPGIIVAFLSYYLTVYNNARQVRQFRANARRLIVLEIAANLKALQAFWQALQALDKEPQGKNAEQHLAELASNGLLAYTPPSWSATHWERFPADAIGAFSANELDVIDAHYRGMPQVVELFTKLVTLAPDEKDILNKDRFWFNRFADWRSTIYTRLNDQVNALLKAPSVG